MHSITASYPCGSKARKHRERKTKYRHVQRSRVATRCSIAVCRQPSRLGALRYRPTSRSGRKPIASSHHRIILVMCAPRNDPANLRLGDPRWSDDDASGDDDDREASPRGTQTISSVVATTAVPSALDRIGTAEHITRLEEPCIAVPSPVSPARWRLRREEPCVKGPIIMYDPGDERNQC